MHDIKISTLFVPALLVILIFACAPQNEKVVPEMVINVPDPVKPDVKNIIVRVMAKDLMPFEVDVMTEQEFDIPTGRDRTITATVLDKHGNVRATGLTKCNISSTERTINLNLIVPPAAPVLLTAELADHSCNLCWSKYVPQEQRAFAAYRIYRAHVADVNEICDLVKEIKDIDDTMFVDKLPDQSQDYYYKIYVFEKTGCFNASNQVQATRSIAVDNKRT